MWGEGLQVARPIASIVEGISDPVGITEEGEGWCMSLLFKVINFFWFLLVGHQIVCGLGYNIYTVVTLIIRTI